MDHQSAFGPLSNALQRQAALIEPGLHQQGDLLSG
jgi:hypothetical protein